MQLWRVFSSLIICAIVVLPQLAVAAVDCGAEGEAGTGGDANAPVYVPGPDSKYILEQPFGGVAEVSNIGEYIQLVYQFALGVVGIFAVVLIMFGGLRWISAAGNESVIGEAKEIITSAVTGLAIALLSYIILAFINPQTLKTDVAVFKIPLPPTCPYEDPETKVIPDSAGLLGNGKSLCSGGVDELVRIADYMVNGADGAGGVPGSCPTCKIGVSSGVRTHEKQRELRECYERAVEDGVTDGSKCPSGCETCNLAAQMCCSEHEHAKAVDVWLEGVPEGLGAATTSKGFLKGKYNNGGGDAALAKNQQLLRDAMQNSAASSKFKGISSEWWHFNFKGECATETACRAVADSSGRSVANNSYCFASTSDNKTLYRYATCTAGKAACDAGFGGYTWYTATSGSDCNFTQFSGDMATAPSQTYLTKPSCVVTNECPFVAVTTEQGEQIDNNILPQSQDVLGDQMVQDLYRLRYQPTLTNHQTYRISILEWEREKTNLDRIQLWSIPQQSNVAITQEQTIVQYQPVSTVQDCLFNNVIPCLDKLSSQDQTFISGKPGDIMELQLSRTDDATVSFMLYARGRDYSALPDSAPAADKSIMVAVQTTDGSWIQLKKLHPREHWSDTELLDLSNVTLPTDHIRIRLTWTGRHDIDFAQLVTTQPITDQQPLPLISARHSQFGDALPQLMNDDQHAITLQPGQRINLEFLVPTAVQQNPGSLFLESRGYYYRLSTQGEPAEQ